MGKRKKIGHISLWVEPEFKKILEDYAVKDKRSLSGLVEKILDDWVKEKEKEEHLPKEVPTGTGKRAQG